MNAKAMPRHALALAAILLGAAAACPCARADEPAAPQGAEAAAPSPPAAAVKRTAKPPPAKAPVAPVQPPTVSVELSDAKAGQRLTFVWSRRIEYGFAEKDGTASFRFPAALGLTGDALQALVPALAPTLAPREDGITVDLHAPPGVRLVPYRAGKNVVVQVVGKAKGAAPPPPPAAPPVAPPAAAPAGEPPLTPIAAPPAPVAPPAKLAVRFAIEGEAASLRFDWPAPVAGAIFRRGAAVWIVFAAPTQLDLGEVRERGQKMLRAAEQLRDGDATVLRLLPQDGINPSVRRVGNAWLVELKRQRAAPEAPIVLDVRASTPPARVLFRARDAAPALALRDPEVGDTLSVLPVGELGRGIDVEHDFVDFRALPSVQGLVIQRLADDVVVERTAESVEVTRPGGLVLSSDSDRLLGRAPETLHRLFDFTAWRGPATESFVAQRSAFEQTIAAAPAGNRSKPRLDLARFYFANLFGAEALGVLEAIERDDPALAADPSVRAMKGAACLMAGERGCAAQDLGQHVLDKEPEAALWRASLAADAGDAEAVAHDFTTGVSLLPGYPRPLRDRMAVQAATAMLETGQTSAARALIGLALKDDPALPDKAMALYLEGWRQQQEGMVDRAIELYDRVVAMDDRPSRARALYARALALFDAGRADRATTIRTLDGLRFAWRGDAQEFALLRRLGELKLAEGDYRGGLEALRDAAANFPDYAATPAVKKRLAEAFADLFLGAAADDVPPLKALALYDEFHAVAAGGAPAPAIVRKLVDRLVAVDLLDRAADLLDGQVKGRLADLDKARVATQLALLRLLDHKPDLALQALQVEVGREVPPDLLRQREQLRARALVELDRPDEALKAIAGDQTRDADRLRAEIHWHARDWKEAAKVFARLAGDPPAEGKPADDAARIVLSWGAALTLDGDQAGLAKLREKWSAPMAQSTLADAFDVVAGDGGGDKDADPRAIARRIAQVGELQSFMATYRTRLASQKLSAIN